MSNNFPSLTFLASSITSSSGFFLGIAALNSFSPTGTRRALFASLVYLLLTLVSFPVRGERHLHSIIYRNLTVGLVGLGVVPLVDWSFGIALGLPAVVSGIALAAVAGECGRFLRNRFQREQTYGSPSRKKSVLVVGAGEAGEMVLRQLRHQPGLHRRVIGFLDDDPEKQGAYIDGDTPVLGTTEDLVSVCRENKVDEVIIAMPSVDGEVIRTVVGQRSSIQADMRIVPGIRDIIEGDFHWNQIRPVKPEDLLGRETVEVDQERIGNFLRGKRVLVTGAAGSIGSYLVRHVLDYPVESVVGLDFNESALYELEVSDLKPSQQSRFEGVLADVRDRETCRSVFEEYRPDIVLHAAALKHVPMVERHPSEGIKTNVSGCINVFEAAGQFGVDHCLLISTDKAVDPKNVMGFTKKMGERLVGTFQQRFEATRYVAVRFGNVLGSRGSVVPLFKRQIEDGGPVTVTDPDMVRYFMTPTEAVKLVLTAASFEDRGHTYVLDIGDPISIMDLARQLIALMGYEPETEIPIEIVGLREGEALEEKLYADAESPSDTPHPEVRKIKLSGLSDYRYQSFLDYLSELPEDKEALVEDFRGFLES